MAPGKTSRMDGFDRLRQRASSCSALSQLTFGAVADSPPPALLRFSASALSCSSVPAPRLSDMQRLRSAPPRKPRGGGAGNPVWRCGAMQSLQCADELRVELFVSRNTREQAKLVYDDS